MSETQAPTGGAAALLTDTGTPGAAASPQSQPATGASGGGGASSSASSPDWYAGFDDADLRGYVENKGWKDPAAVVDGYRNLEKLLGGEKLPMPKGSDDKEGWSRVYDALGRPKSADDYQLPVPDGGNAEFAKTAAQKMHELGLNAEQARNLAGWWNEHASGLVAAQQAQTEQQQGADLNALRLEWGAEYDRNISQGQRLVREFGLDGATLAKIEGALGTGEMLRLFSKMGTGLTEHSFEGGNTNTSFGMTAEGARSRISQLEKDPAFVQRYISGDAEARTEMERLHRLANPQ